ncbi:MAG: RNA recognition motif domain-containing protein, partial [Opitutales bacterium]
MDIYVGNLPYDLEESELEQAFGAYGTVDSVKIIKDFETGRSKGFAFVVMSNDDEANEAINNLSGAELAGRPMKVNAARPKEDRPPRRDGGGYRGGREGGGGGGYRGGGGGGGYRGGREGGGGGGYRGGREGGGGGGYRG